MLWNQNGGLKSRSLKIIEEKKLTIEDSSVVVIRFSKFGIKILHKRR